MIAHPIVEIKDMAVSYHQSNVTPLANQILHHDAPTLRKIGECAEWYEGNPPFNFSMFVAQIAEIVRRAAVLRNESMSVALQVAAKLIEIMEYEYTVKGYDDVRPKTRSIYPVSYTHLTLPTKRIV